MDPRQRPETPPGERRASAAPGCPLCSLRGPSLASELEVRPRTFPPLRTPVLEPGSGDLCGHGMKICWSHSTVSDKPRDLLRRGCLRLAFAIAAHIPGRKRKACQSQSKKRRRPPCGAVLYLSGPRFFWLDCQWRMMSWMDV